MGSMEQEKQEQIKETILDKKLCDVDERFKEEERTYRELISIGEEKTGYKKYLPSTLETLSNEEIQEYLNTLLNIYQYQSYDNEIKQKERN